MEGWDSKVGTAMLGSGEDGSDRPWQLDLRGSNPGVLAQVRRWVATALADLGDGHLGDVMLVAIELVTNAFDHGDGPRTIRMRRSRRPCVVGIEVEDSDIGRLTPGTSRFGGCRGRGLVIVDKLSATWGIRPQPETGSKIVWAQVSCEAAPCN